MSKLRRRKNTEEPVEITAEPTVSKAEIIRNGSKIKSEERNSKFTFSQYREEVLEIVAFWEALGRPKFKTKNDTNKSFTQAAKYIRNALKGTLYKDTKWEEENQVFSKKQITDAIQKFHQEVERTKKKYQVKLRMVDFFIPNGFTGIESDPEFLNYVEKSTVTSKEIKPLCERALKMVVGEYKRKTKKQNLTQEEVNLLTKLVNKIESEAIYPYFAKQPSYEEALAGAKPNYSRIDPGKGMSSPQYRSFESVNGCCLYEIAFDLILNRKEEQMEDQEYNSIGLKMVTKKNFMQKLRARINWIRALCRQDNHDKYVSLPKKLLKE